MLIVGCVYCSVVCVVLGCHCVFFFFSSRRRHTRCLSDWSSDVCSSDLDRLVGGSRRRRAACPSPRRRAADRSEERRVGKECRSRWSPEHEKKKREAERAGRCGGEEGKTGRSRERDE